jgi:hypothetical protein
MVLRPDVDRAMEVGFQYRVEVTQPLTGDIWSLEAGLRPVGRRVAQFRIRRAHCRHGWIAKRRSLASPAPRHRAAERRRGRRQRPRPARRNQCCAAGQRHHLHHRSPAAPATAARTAGPLRVSLTNHFYGNKALTCFCLVEKFCKLFGLGNGNRSGCRDEFTPSATLEALKLIHSTIKLSLNRASVSGDRV